MSHIKIDIFSTGSEIEISRLDRSIGDATWSAFVSNLMTILKDSRYVDSSLISPIAEFLFKREHIVYLANNYDFVAEYSESIRLFAANWVNQKKNAESVLNGSYEPIVPSAEEIQSLLVSEGWLIEKRQPTPEQYQNIAKLSTLNNGANFSVPGSGKTTSALASHFAARATGQVENLLVVAPRSAFVEWKEALEKISEENLAGFIPLIDGRQIPDLLRSNPKYSLITYHQLIRVVPHIEKFLNSRSVHLVLDESHRIKAGEAGAFAKSCLRISPLASRRDILSGTPAPQSLEDLIPQLNFLYPGMGVGLKLDNIGFPSNILKRFYARTTYKELGLKKIEVEYFEHELTKIQLALYTYLKDELVRMRVSLVRLRDSVPDARNHLIEEKSSAQICVMRLLQSAIDPQLAARSILASSDADDALKTIASEVMSEGDIGSRLKAVISEARKFAAEGRKTVIWAPFVGTIDLLRQNLSDIGAQPIYGQKSKSLEDENEYIERESILSEFLDESRSDRWTLIINPAAGSEGISLHRVCQHAIYAGRTYNAAHYMQSRDRINRLDMPEGTYATMTIHGVKTPSGVGSIDTHLNKRLNSKIGAMAKVLDDDDLKEIALDSENAPRSDSDISLDEVLDLIFSLETN